MTAGSGGNGRAAGVRVRPARRDDAVDLMSMVRRLAKYEHLEHTVRGDAEALATALFDEGAAEALVADVDGEAAGYAIYFTTFSSFECRPGLWVEDLFVSPARRGEGIGRALLGHIAGLAVARECARMEWSALDWNKPALRFYEGLGATELGQWKTLRLEGDALKSLASESRRRAP